MKRLVCLMLALIVSTALAGCNTGTAPPAATGQTGQTPDVYTPDPNNVLFSDKDLTTNFTTDNPLYAMPNTSWNAGG